MQVLNIKRNTVKIEEELRENRNLDRKEKKKNVKF